MNPLTTAVSSPIPLGGILAITAFLAVTLVVVYVLFQT